jgi:predicted alpha/beta hydrolase
MREQDLSIPSTLGATLHARWLEPDGDPKATIVIAPAMGVQQGYYLPFAKGLAEAGIRALVLSYRGIERSTLGDLSGAEVGLTHWAEDVDAALGWALTQTPAQPSAQTATPPVFQLGHSCGGQLLALTPNSERLAGVIQVASQCAYWRHWPMPSRLGMAALWHAALPLLSRGHTFPARTLRMFAFDIPSGPIRQWAAWGRLPGYLFDPASGADARRSAHLTLPILAHSFLDDLYAPPLAVAALLAQYPRAAITHHAHPAAAKLGHFGFFRSQHRDALWRPTIDWLLAIATAPAS